jgi:hypothetical protein
MQVIKISYQKKKKSKDSKAMDNYLKEKCHHTYDNL